jgi:rhodanese-related sulfurtransferase
MKKLILLLLFSLALYSCQETKDGKIEMISPEQVYDAVYSENSLQLVDVRTEDEYAVSHLKNAQNICVTNDDFEKKVEGLDKDKPVYVYCQKGGRSARAAEILKELGFTKVYDLQGGIENWEDKNLETVKNEIVPE